MTAISKKQQVGRFGRKAKATRDNVPGSKTEEPVQAACDHILKMRHIEFLRFPDWFWTFIHAVSSRVPERMKILLGLQFGGWADDIAFIPINDKYSLCVFIENKSKTGKFSSKEQKRKAKALNYIIPRSPQEVADEIRLFELTAEKLKKHFKKEDL